MPSMRGGFLDIAVGALEGGDDQLLSPSPAASCRRGSTRAWWRRCAPGNAKSSSVRIGPRQVTIARSTAFSSSRTLPGQLWSIRSLQRALGDVADVLAEFVREALQEVVGQQRDVLAPLAQRRNADLDDVQAVVQILAELAFGDGLLQIRRGSPRSRARRRAPPRCRRRGRSCAPAGRAAGPPAAWARCRRSRRGRWCRRRPSRTCRASAGWRR